MHKKWEEQGCEYCRQYWLARDGDLELINTSTEYHSRLYKCPKCNSLWEENERFACEVTANDVIEYHGEALREHNII